MLQQHKQEVATPITITAHPRVQEPRTKMDHPIFFDFEADKVTCTQHVSDMLLTTDLELSSHYPGPTLELALPQPTHGPGPVVSVMTSYTRYIPELTYALAFSSISVNLLWKRRAAETDRRHYSARLSILGELATRLRAGDPVSDAEVARLRRLAETVKEDTHLGESIGWREVIFGRKESGVEREAKEELERRELERVQSELLRADDITQRP